jgi:hypothetical protein
MTIPLIEAKAASTNVRTWWRPIPANGGSVRALEGSDGPWVVTERIWKAGIVHIQ